MIKNPKIKIQKIILAGIACLMMAGIFGFVPVASALNRTDQAAIGAGIGAGVGAAAGSVVPGAGTVIGGMAGGAAGAVIGENAAAVGSALGDAWNALCDGIMDCENESDDVVSFVGFQGGLTAPTGEGLDSSLTRARSAREFIVNTVNFALSFLGLIAMVIVIYGGFLYVTAAGNEEQSGKGKKAVTYAAIGIVIIIASFAIVNTLLTFSGGTGSDREGVAGGGGGSGGSDNLRGVNQEGTNIGQQSIYNFGATEINSSLNTFVSAYKTLLLTKSAIEKINTIIPQPPNKNDNKAYFSNVSSIVTQIKNNSRALSNTYMKSRSFLDGWIAQTSMKDLTAPEYENGGLRNQFKAELAKSGIEAASEADFLAIVNELVGKLNNVKKILGGITDAPLSNYTGRNFNTDKNMQRAFAGIDMTRPIKEVFDEAMKDVEAAKDLKSDPKNVGLVVNLAQSLNRLFIVTKNIEFVFVKIKASAREGNAPFVVELNGLGSRDPTGDTIADERYEWDPEGTYSEEKKNQTSSKADCNMRQGPTIVCTYSQPGTYVVRLTVKSSDPSRIAIGQAYLPITVLPSIARISLKATAGGVTEELREYEKDEKGKWNLVLDKREFQVTTAEAKAGGIAFDASESEAGSGGAIQAYEWTYGDGTGVEKTPTVKHQYKTSGKFPLKLEVTDTGNRKDRKFVDIIVAAIAARMQLNKTIAEPDELIECDGSISRSDRGSISSYIWKITKDEEDVTALQNVVSIVGDTNSSVLRFKLKTPGTYSVSLEVSDGSINATREETISIKSRKPRANFSARSCPDDCPDPSTPNVVELDASTSYDPDKDPLIYTWSVFSDGGDEISEGTIFSELNGNPLYGPDAKKVSLKFNKVGKYKIRLALQDDLPDELMQTDIKEKNIQISSIVEAGWDPQLNPVTQLSNGKATIELNGQVLNASLLKWDFGDGFTTDTSVDASQNGAFSFSHDYTAAGTFLVTLKAVSEDGSGENTITKRVYVSAGDVPMAVMEVSANNVPVVLDGTPLEILRNKVIKFDAGYSLNSKGKAEGLKFSWDFGDQKRSTGAKVEHAYEDVSPDKPYTVTLIATEDADPTKTSEATFEVSVISKKPIVNTLSLERKTTGDKTPVDVILTAEGAQDPDGKVSNYQFWYYDPANKEQKLAVMDTPSDHATLTVETSGEENQEHEYYFCVSVTDNENTTSNCEDLFDESELPKLKVKNGPNKAPVAKFAVDRTTAKVNEELTFTSSSTDEDGRIVQYVWDTEGDGFQNDNPTELSTITHKYTRKSPRSGYRVKLKVIDDKGAAGFSKETIINVDTKSNPPSANFTYIVQENRQVKFIDSSTFDTTNGAKPAKWTWDFDTSQEFGCTDPQNKPIYCNGNKSDDADSTDQNPIYVYTTSGTYQVKLTVEDSDGNISEPKTALVNLIAGMAGGSNGVSPTAGILKAELRTDPMFKYEKTKDGKQIKVIHLPANSNGQNITLLYGNSTGNIKEYKIDKNTWCDSDGNGNKADDVNNAVLFGATCQRASTGETAENCWTTNYSRYAKTGSPKGPGNFITMLSVVDRNGVAATDTVEIVFDGATDPSKMIKSSCEPKKQLLSGSLFTDLGTQNIILISVVGGVILVLVIAGAASLVRRGKEREI